LCPIGTYLLCDGTSFGSYACNQPELPWIVLPFNASTLPSGFVSPIDLPAQCSGQVYDVVLTTPVCQGGEMFLLCDGCNFDGYYDCENPGGGWMLTTDNGAATDAGSSGS